MEKKLFLKMMKQLWNSNGKDIYYQGESKENLPIDMKISYKLDDKDISSDEIIFFISLIDKFAALFILSLPHVK